MKSEGRGQRVEDEEDAERKVEGRGQRAEGAVQSSVPDSIQNSKFKIQNSLDRPWKPGDPIVEPQGVYQLPNGQLVMSRECSD
ncbi:hypothetical protein K9N68_29180 [Kovacikia minuta CCNUW1]|uniref:hypothetical protein n=1 Tax=Kovacikia minuta TaxID=2931930 RepID=UPI001CCC1E9C|nr:hypothetical protein [Kovacikia minuta]UBF25599.1 hypothetical protein K9N68_29180 [Kovacikia minuta CCNUW1]